MQTERAKDLNWKSNQFTGKIEHDEHHIRSSNNGPAAAPKRSQPLLALPAPSELTVTFKRYVVEMIEKVANSKDADANEPEWKVNEFKGRISHRHNGDHHGHWCAPASSLRLYAYNLMQAVRYCPAVLPVT